MGITPMFNASDLMKGVHEEIQRMEQMIQNELVNVGLDFMGTARVKADFKDQSGALRSSIGFEVFKDGVSVFENYEPSTKGSPEGREKGIETAKAYVQKVFNEHRVDIGFILICVAGMEYAVYVEAKGYDVITGSSLKAEEDLKDVFRRLESMK